MNNRKMDSPARMKQKKKREGFPSRETAQEKETVGGKGMRGETTRQQTTYISGKRVALEGSRLGTAAPWGGER